MKRGLKTYPLFLLLLPLFIVLHLERAYHGLIIYRFVATEIMVLFIAPVIAWALAWLITRSRVKAGILAVILLVVFYFFGEMKDALKEALPNSIWQSYTLLLPLTLLLVVIAAIAIRRNRRSNFQTGYLFLNTVLLLFVLFDAGVILWQEIKPAGKTQQASQLANNCNDCDKPDIYFFIFDSYTSTQLLKKEFEYDNSAIDSSLQQRGFKVISQSRSNYNLTPFSISSTFNFSYNTNVDTSKNYYLRNFLPGVVNVYESRLFPILSHLGYEIHNYSLFDVRSHPTAIPHFDTWGLNTLFQQHNMLQKIDNDLGWQFPAWLQFSPPHSVAPYARNRDRHDSATLVKIRQVIREAATKPRFVYGHLFLPHSPYTFDSAGNNIEPINSMPLRDDMRAYTQQVHYVNSIMTALVDGILARPGKKPIIIIMGDHGYRFFDLTRKALEFPNFKAFYFPDKNYSSLNDSITNINTFPVVFNTYFRQQIPLQPDHFYFLKYK